MQVLTTTPLPSPFPTGANPDEYETLISHALDIGLDMIGVSFHVGSLAKSGKAFHRAIECV
jgi:diaminopimelate decarboxylase